MPKGIYIRTEECRKNLSLSHKGKPSPRKGVLHSEESKLKMSKSALGRIPFNKGIPMSKEKYEKCRKTFFQKGHNAWAKNKIFSEKHRKNLSLSHKGKYCGNNSPTWKGGITPLNSIIRNSDKYNEWRIQNFIRDEFTCQECGQIGGKLHVHHIKPFAVILKTNNITTFDSAVQCVELWDLNNGVTLCEKCHKQLRKKI